MHYDSFTRVSRNIKTMVTEADWWLSRVDMGTADQLQSGMMGHLGVMEMFYIMMVTRKLQVFVRTHCIFPKIGSF